jgi:phosphatidylglycerophosphate synthase
MVPFRIVALTALIAAFTTDLVDGQLARRREVPRPPLEGTVFDTTADSFTFVLVFGSLVHVNAAVPSVFVAVLLGRALLDLMRVFSLVRCLPFPTPTRLTKLKGVSYSFLAPVLYSGNVGGILTPLTNSALRAAIQIALVAVTLVAVIHFFGRHRKYVALLLVN